MTTKETWMNPSVLEPCGLIKPPPAEQSYRPPSESWTVYERRTSPWMIGLLLVCLSLLGGCAVPGVKPPVVVRCNPPQAQLQPTPTPPLSDATNGDLLAEANAVREALGQANADKQAVLEYIRRRCK